MDWLREIPGNLAESIAETLHLVTGVCDELGVRATLNLAVSDGKAMAFARYSTEGPGNSLYFVEDGEAFPQAVVVAFERLDGDSRWQEVPDRHLLVVKRSGAMLRPL